MKQVIPKGRLIVIGGAEDKGDGDVEMAAHSSEYEEMEILKELVSGKHQNPRIEVVTTATNNPEKQKRKYKESLEKAGYKNVGFINIQDKDQAHEEEFIQRVKKAKAVLFGGGDQFKITTISGGTPFADAIKEKYYTDKDFTVAGTSAGAGMASEIMIQGGGVYEALVESDLKTGGGLGLVSKCVIDTHFVKRGRIGRLTQAIVRNPGNLGIGLGEDTAIVIKKGYEAKCLGSGMVVLVDGREIRNTNIVDAEDCPIYVDNLRVHLLVKGCKFNIETCELEFPKKTKQ